MSQQTHDARLRTFIAALTQVVDRQPDVAARQRQGRDLLAALVAEDGWLPETATVPHPEHYQQYLLHCDPLERFSVLSFVWGPGQTTPIHDHTVWGLIGMLRGSEVSQHYTLSGDGLQSTERVVLQPGDVAALLPDDNDIHKVDNAYDDRVSISIHVYGANIASVRRHVFDPESGSARDFVSGYSAAVVPNVWDRSAEIRATIAR